MMRGMYSAISGLRNHQIMLDVTANDLANVNTVGFKASRTSFRDSLAQLQRSGASATTGSAGAKSAQIGLGVQLGSIDNLMTNGAFQSTGSPYDVAITGTGWFRVSNTDPTAGATAGRPRTRSPASSTSEYTRAGNFTLNDQGELATQDGWRVVGKGVDPHHRRPSTTDIVIKVPAGATDVSISPDGAVTYTPAGGGTRATAGFLSLAGFPNESGLDRMLGQPLEGDRQLRRRRRRHARRQRPRPDRRRPARDEQRRPGDRVHQHDHRAARLRGQLACALDHRRDAADPRQPQALGP